MRVVENAQLNRQLEDMKRRLAVGQRLAEHLLRLERRLNLHSYLSNDATEWLKADTLRYALWYEICCKADTDGLFQSSTMHIHSLIPVRKRAYCYRRMCELGLLEAQPEKGVYKIVSNSNDG